MSIKKSGTKKATTKKASKSEPRMRNPLRPPSTIQKLYDVLWQLEAWLREMVYVELRTRDAAWETAIKKRVKNWPPRSQTNDKAYWHMSTRHQSAVSYLTTGELFDIICDDENWNLFEDYFPKKALFLAKIDEIKQIRNRVAHFRAPHDNDLDRVRLLLKDIDTGIWKFCTSYNEQLGSLPKGFSDPATRYFAKTHPVRAVVEMNVIADSGHGEHWLYARDRLNPSLGVFLRYSVRNWATLTPPSIMGHAGVIYRVSFMALRAGDGSLAHEHVLQETQSVHKNCTHIALSGPRSMEVSVPAIVGEDTVTKTIERFVEVCSKYARFPSPTSRSWLATLANRWPEYVLPPSHPLGFLTDDMPCNMFVL
ncbi:hypothetical protein [Corallococcus sp. CA047B]|uniref:hypothetical protein n=1 Tax=Corallococcus sp. CA047B TaxID=2316729 RepID=UPI0011C489C7|nr:hypothetical protein [Corallococcus sp. CA047B]